MHQNKDLRSKQKINVNVTFIMLRLFHLNLQDGHRVSWKIVLNFASIYFKLTYFQTNFHYYLTFLVKFEYWRTVFIKF